MDLLAAGVYDLGLTAAEFSTFTPRHIDHFYKRHLNAEARRMQLTLWYANVHRDTEKKPEPFSIDDFVPGVSSLGTVTVRAMERMPGETVEDFLARISRPTMDPELQVARIQIAGAMQAIRAGVPGHVFGRWTVENG